ncbi:adenylate/guanylate cyclase domain-containing protein [Rivibacter subsaxonicus]|uniref:Class 3 adenylate cyclase n=1 Tax=Rivibacter subsaxonicus TaxID=457575 RepID=A0A4Q7W120_9BURK|nr:adenylate/guanylate cyclase domain-containing protein [Rivibacter subsaxonicus]RZU02535.1 class 3 adenylate cyclase [Rivibacter subsaxonicus]
MTSIIERTVLFADLRGSTGLYESLGNAQAAAVVTHSVGLMVQLVDHFGGRVVKTLGDGLMAVFEQPQDAVDAADEMHEAIERIVENEPRSGKRLPALKLQIAMSHGEVVELQGDCFGDAVNVAARLIDSAGDDETLSTEQVVRRLEEQHRGRFRSLSQLQLRGRAEPVHVLRLEAKRFGETVATLFEGTLPNPTPDSIRLVWLDVERILSAPDMPAVLGRSAEATYVIEDSRVSRSHARIERHGGTFQISDLSYNGTFVRFLGQNEFVSLRRGSCTLHGRGVICLGAAPNDPTAPTVQFEVLTPPDTVRGGAFAAG